MSKFTPGPWKAVKYSKMRIGLCCPGQGAWALLTGTNVDADHPVLRANARLIAAAPDLYEALRNAIDRLEDMLKGDDGQAWKEAERVMPRLRAALAKVDA